MEEPPKPYQSDPAKVIEEDSAKFLEAKEEVKRLIKLMVEKIGVDIPENDWPKIKLSPPDLETSAYSPIQNVLYIYPERIGSGATYGEEISHFIRGYILDHKGGLSGNLDIFDAGAVDEFFGRVGENIARLVSENQELFKDQERKMRETDFALTLKDIEDLSLFAKVLEWACSRNVGWNFNYKANPSSRAWRSTVLTRGGRQKTKTSRMGGFC